MTTGVQITSSSGQPGANQSIRIRGMGSFNAYTRDPYKVAKELGINVIYRNFDKQRGA